jgi:hypothetical protein
MGCIETESLPLCYEYEELNKFYPINDYTMYILFISNILSLILLNILLFRLG